MEYRLCSKKTVACALCLFAVESTSSRVHAQELPELQVDSVARDVVQLSWPAAPETFQLEASSDLLSFERVDERPRSSEDDDRLVTTLRVDTPLRYFRLRKTKKLSVAINEGFTVEGGGSMVLTPDHLSVTNSDSPPEEIVYSIGQAGVTGFVAFANAPNDPVTDFSHADLAAEKIVYRDGFNGIVLPELRADSFSFQVFDAHGGQSDPRSFLVLRDPMDIGRLGEVSVWKPDDRETFRIGGGGDDSFVVRGRDGADEVEMSVSDDGTQIVFSRGEGPPITIDEFEDVYFIMGEGANKVRVIGDFVNTDLSPSTIIFVGGSDVDELDALSEGLTAFSATDVIAMMKGGDDDVNLTHGVRGALISTGPGDDWVRGSQGHPGFTFTTFMGPGLDKQNNSHAHSYTFFLHEANPGVTVTETSESQQARYAMDVDSIFDAYRTIRKTNIDSTGTEINLEDSVRGRTVDPEAIAIHFGRQVGATIDHTGEAFVIDQPFNLDPSNIQSEIGIGEPLRFVEEILRFECGNLSREACMLLPEVDRPGPVAFPLSNYSEPVYRIRPRRSTMADSLGRNFIVGFELTMKGWETAPRAGKETLRGAEFNDVIFAGDNPNTEDSRLAFPSVDSDRLFGLGGDDWMVGDRLDNYFDGGTGDDRLEGRRGDDLFVWSLGNDLIDGGDGFDIASYETDPFQEADPANQARAITVNPRSAGGFLVNYEGMRISDGARIGPFTDTLIDIEEILGSNLGDSMIGTNLGDRLLGKFGNDVIEGRGGNDHLEGGPGEDRIDGGAGEDTIVGDADDRLIVGGPDNDTISGAGTVRGDGGNDSIVLLAASNVDGGEDDDTITGSNSADTLDGGPGRDTIHAERGDDTGIFVLGEVGSQPDFYDGGEGTDTLQVIVSDLVAVTPPQITGLRDLQSNIRGALTFPGLNLEIRSWELVEILDRRGDTVNLDDLTPRPPTDIHLSPGKIREETPGAFVGELTAVDPNNVIGDTHSFTITDARFEVRNERDLYLKFSTRVDFEQDPSINIQITATDLAGLSIAKRLIISIIDLPDTPMAPTDLRLTNLSVAEENPGRAVSFVEVEDPNPGETHTFSLSDPRFEIVDDILKLKGGVAVDFETASITTLNIEVADKDGLSLEKTFTITVIDIDANAAPPSLPENHFFVDGKNGFIFNHSLLTRGVVAGASLASAGDMTGDGIDDLLTVANAPFGVKNDNFAFLVPGRSGTVTTRIWQHDLAAMGGTFFTLRSSELESRAASITGLGDFNGDGFNDIAIGMGGAESEIGDFEAGQAYLVMGRPGGLPAEMDLSEDATFDGVSAFRINGTASDRLGSTVESPGDIDGDGLQDALIGREVTRFKSGGAVILYGSASAYPADVPWSNLDSVEATVVTSGAVESLGDVNGDGLGDFFVSLVDSQRGALVFGKRGGLPRTIDPEVGYDVLVSVGSNRSLPAIPGVAGRAGDVNGDGIDDVFIVTHALSIDKSKSNELIILSGGAFPDEAVSLEADLSGSIGYLSEGTRGFRVVPAGNIGRTSDVDSTFVKGVAPAGDVNGDGFDDLLLRISEKTGPLKHVVLFGRLFGSELVEMDPAILVPPSGLALGFETKAGFELDQGLGGPADLNGDGFADILFADPEADFGFGILTSVVYAVRGADFGATSVTHGGTHGDDFLLGRRNVDDVIFGGMGDDDLFGRGGQDSYHGGVGDDLIVLSGNGSPVFDSIHGGAGLDTVRLQGNGLTWRVNAVSGQRVQSIEVIDLGRGGGQDRHEVVITKADLISLPGTGRALTVLGDEFDRVTFHGTLQHDRKETRNLIEFDVFKTGGSEVELVIAEGLQR